MSLRKLLGKLLVLVTLEFGSLCGVSMTPEEIEKLMNVMHRVKIVKIVKTESD